MDLLPRGACDYRAAHHHGANANHHNPAVGNGVNRYQYAYVLTVDIQRGTDSHGVDGVILSLDSLGCTHDAVDGDVEPMIILRRKTEDSQRTVSVSFGVLRVTLSEQAFNREFSSLDPDLGGIIDAVEDHRSAVGRRDDNVRVVRCRAWSRVWFQFTVEEFVEVFELFNWQLDLVHIELMEVDELGNLSFRGRIIVFDTLLDAQAAEQRSNCEAWLVADFHSYRTEMYGPKHTSLGFHIP